MSFLFLSLPFPPFSLSNPRESRNRKGNEHHRAGIHKTTDPRDGWIPVDSSVIEAHSLRCPSTQLAELIFMEAEIQRQAASHKGLDIWMEYAVISHFLDSCSYGDRGKHRCGRALTYRTRWLSTALPLSLARCHIMDPTVTRQRAGALNLWTSWFLSVLW